eukprot:TRINITY_DN8006_c0_g2_i1.p1 TRINITY_DN8006_c0_g2~~TRINITY_DN8006_c0_g2_i1.p1  ORF type:complete len:753 (-),score=129.64 TRINITY_DN8006_c0_g2_i1:148-2406(-)
MTSNLRSSGGFNTSNTSKKLVVGAAPVKKIVINLKEAPKLPENYEEETWQKLHSAINAINHSKSVQYSLEELYKAVENLCQNKMAGNLYNRLQATIDNHILTEELPRVLQSRSLDPTFTLTLVNSAWTDHCDRMIKIRSVFLYLDRTFVMQSQSLRSLWDLGLYLFRTHITSNEDVLKKTILGLLQSIENERKGETVDRGLIKSLLRMFMSLGQYNDKFEQPFLESSSEFYGKEGERYIDETDVADYLKHVEKRLLEENERVMHYLDIGTKKALITVVERQLLENHVGNILKKGFQPLMNDNRTTDLSRMYVLLARVNALDKLKIALKDYVRTVGTSIVSDTEKDPNMVQDLLEFKSKLDIVMEQSFNKNESFSNTLKESFEQFINSRPNKPAELVAKYIDNLLKTGGRGMSEEDLEKLFDRLMVLFRYIQGKDVFEAFYKKDLAKRLLLNKSSSIDAEKSVVARIKTECGSTFTSKLEGMFKDMDLTKDIMANFSIWRSQNENEVGGNIELNVSVLTTGYWPPYNLIEVKLPKEFLELQEFFKRFYLMKHGGRKLQWNNSLGHCVLQASFPAGRKELQVSLFQATVLMLFNENATLGYKDISVITGLDDKELSRTLNSLTQGATKILLRETKNQTEKKDISDSDSFTFNKKFTHKLVRIKVNSVQMKETQEEQKKTEDDVFQNRQYQVDAAIVRIMKTRKILTHALLVSEATSQLGFSVKPLDLKKRIESLIDREYLERDPNNPQLYSYLA